MFLFSLKGGTKKRHVRNVRKKQEKEKRDGISNKKL